MGSHLCLRLGRSFSGGQGGDSSKFCDCGMSRHQSEKEGGIVGVEGWIKRTVAKSGSPVQRIHSKETRMEEGSMVEPGLSRMDSAGWAQQDGQASKQRYRNYGSGQGNQATELGVQEESHRDHMCREFLHDPQLKDLLT